MQWRLQSQTNHANDVVGFLGPLHVTSPEVPRTLRDFVGHVSSHCELCVYCTKRHVHSVLLTVPLHTAKFTLLVASRKSRYDKQWRSMSTFSVFVIAASFDNRVNI